jgi:exodeoxyribonuclease VII small subunit
MAKKKAEPKFEDLVQDVESTLERLESGELPLEDALKHYEDGVSALRKCFTILKQAEKRVQVLNDRDGDITAEPMDVDEVADEGDGDDKKDDAKLF